MSPLSALLSIGIALAVLLVGAMWWALLRRSLRGSALRRIEAAWRHALSQSNATLRIVEADKVLDTALTLLSYEGTLGEKLKKAGPRFSDVNGLWTAHKLRNQLVHALNAQPNASDVDRAMRSFERALRDVGMK